jgi:hypothetical protein
MEHVATGIDRQLDPCAEAVLRNLIERQLRRQTWRQKIE